LQDWVAPFQLNADSSPAYDPRLALDEWQNIFQ